MLPQEADAFVEPALRLLRVRVRVLRPSVLAADRERVQRCLLGFGDAVALLERKRVHAVHEPDLSAGGQRGCRHPAHALEVAEQQAVGLAELQREEIARVGRDDLFGGPDGDLHPALHPGLHRAQVQPLALGGRRRGQRRIEEGPRESAGAARFHEHHQRGRTGIDQRTAGRSLGRLNDRARPVAVAQHLIDEEIESGNVGRIIGGHRVAVLVVEHRSFLGGSGTGRKHGPPRRQANTPQRRPEAGRPRARCLDRQGTGRRVGTTRACSLPRPGAKPWPSARPRLAPRRVPSPGGHREPDALGWARAASWPFRPAASAACGGITSASRRGR